MLSINKNNIECELEFDGIKIFQTQNPTKLYKDLILDSVINIDNKSIKLDNVIYINELTKLTDFVNLNKKSFLIKEIINLLEQYPIINISNINNIKDYINNKYQEELIDTNEGDNNKLINLFIEFINQEYLNKSLFKLILDYCFEDSKLIILDNVSWIELNDLYGWLNEHKFIIITYDFREYIKNASELELLVTFKQNYDYVEMLDSNKLIVYLEKHMNIEVNKEKINTWLNNKNNLESLSFLSNILKI